MELTIGIIGAGNIGGALARKLHGAGREVLVCDTDEAVVNALAMEGIDSAPDPAALADRAQIICVCLADPSASRKVANVAKGGKALEIWVETSTLAPADVEAIAANLAPFDISVVDAPVSGGPRAIRAGNLTMLLAGEASARTRVLEALAPCIGRGIQIGDKPGAAQVCKLVNNAISLSILALTSEAMVAGVAAGAEAGVLLEVVNAGTGMSAVSRDKFPDAILNRRFGYGGNLSMTVKDLTLYLSEAGRYGFSSPLVAGALKIWQQAAQELPADADMTEVIRYYESRSGVLFSTGAGAEP